MFKGVNRDFKTYPFKPQQKKRPFAFGNKIDIQLSDRRQPLERYVSFINECHIKQWLKYEVTTYQLLSKDDKVKRNRIFEWMIKDVKPILNLKLRTIEHSMKLMDIYECKKDQKINNTKSQTRNKSIYPTNDELILDIVTCLNISCKYNEIYPPQLCQIYRLTSSKATIQQVLDNQISILQALDYNLNIALPSDWFKMFNQDKLPVWASFCFLQYEMGVESKFICQQIRRFIQKMNQSQQNRQTFAEFSKLCSQVYNDISLKLIEAFSDFRFRRQISTLELTDEQMINKVN